MRKNIFFIFILLICLVSVSLSSADLTNSLKELEDAASRYERGDLSYMQLQTFAVQTRDVLNDELGINAYIIEDETAVNDEENYAEDELSFEFAEELEEHFVNAELAFYDNDFDTVESELEGAEKLLREHNFVKAADLIDNMVDAVRERDYAKVMKYAGKIDTIMRDVFGSDFEDSEDRKDNEDRDHERHFEGVSAEALRKVFGDPTRYTEWGWDANEEKSIKLDKKLPEWEKTLHEGDTLKIIFLAHPNLLKVGGATTIFYWTNIEVRFVTPLGISTEEAVNLLKDTEDITELANVASDIETQFNSYLEQNREQCTLTMKELLSNSKVTKQEQLKKKIVLARNKDIEIILESNECVNCEYSWIWSGVRVDVFDNHRKYENVRKLEQANHGEWSENPDLESAREKLPKVFDDLVFVSKKYVKDPSFFGGLFEVVQDFSYVREQLNSASGMDHDKYKDYTIDDYRSDMSSLFEGYKVYEHLSKETNYRLAIVEEKETRTNSWCEAREKDCASGECSGSMCVGKDKDKDKEYDEIDNDKGEECEGYDEYVCDDYGNCECLDIQREASKEEDCNDEETFVCENNENCRCVITKYKSYDDIKEDWEKEAIKSECGTGCEEGYTCAYDKETDIERCVIYEATECTHLDCEKGYKCMQNPEGYAWCEYLEDYNDWEDGCEDLDCGSGAYCEYGKCIDFPVSECDDCASKCPGASSTSCTEDLTCECHYDETQSPETLAAAIFGWATTDYDYEKWKEENPEIYEADKENFDREHEEWLAKQEEENKEQKDAEEKEDSEEKEETREKEETEKKSEEESKDWGCALLDCLEGYECIEQNGKANCVEKEKDWGCASIYCQPGYWCVEEDGNARCITTEDKGDFEDFEGSLEEFEIAFDKWKKENSEEYSKNKKLYDRDAEEWKKEWYRRQEKKKLDEEYRDWKKENPDTRKDDYYKDWKEKYLDYEEKEYDNICEPSWCGPKQECSEEYNGCNCVEGYHDCDGDWINGCESTKECRGCTSDLDCAPARCSEDGHRSISFVCKEQDSWEEDKYAIYLQGSCNKEPNGEINGWINVDAWGEGFEDFHKLKEQNRNYQDSWCIRELTSAEKQRREIENSFNQEFLSWYFERIEQNPEDFEKHERGISEIFYSIVGNVETIARSEKCSGGKIKLNPINLAYEDDFGKIEYWEEYVYSKQHDREILTPFMKRWFYPTKETMKAMLRQGPPEHERKEGFGPPPHEIRDMRRFKPVMETIRGISERFGGSADIKILIKDRDEEGNEEIINGMVMTINEDVLVHGNFIEDSKVQDIDATVNIEFNFLYDMISTHVEKFEGERVETAWWVDERERRNFDDGPGIGTMVKVFTRIVNGMVNKEITVDPTSRLDDIILSGKDMLTLMLKAQSMGGR
jgi:hypothetical protein